MVSYSYLRSGPLEDLPKTNTAQGKIEPFNGRRPDKDGQLPGLLLK